MTWFVTLIFHVPAGWFAPILSLAPQKIKSKVIGRGKDQKWKNVRNASLS